jgi:hypothetical protein
MMAFDVAHRTRLAADLLTALGAAIPGSDVDVRGSLAEGRADLFSDIDLLWEVPDARFAQAIAMLPVILTQVAPVASLRCDPDFQRSRTRRLVFIRFAGVPLFWRVDLDVFARSAGRDADHDRGNPAARGTAWSAPESSLANAVAAVKACARGDVDKIEGLLSRAEQRIGLPASELSLRPRIERLADAAVAIEPTLAPFAAEVRRLAARIT